MIQAQVLDGEMLGNELIAELGVADCGTFKSELYSYMSRLIRFRFIPILRMRIMEFCSMMSSSKPFLNVDIVCSISQSGTWKTLAMGRAKLILITTY